MISTSVMGVSSRRMEHESYWIASALVGVILFLFLAMQDHFSPSIRRPAANARMWLALLPPAVAVLLPLVMLSGMLKENGNLRFLELICVLALLIQLCLTRSRRPSRPPDDEARQLGASARRWQLKGDQDSGPEGRSSSTLTP
ncbi:MAG: hypothetical protein QOI81_1620 [Actinomycetota bacterium]|nr:hypothetical protein [Actinomycetota bacterium]